MDTTDERVKFIENETWDELVERENRARVTLGIAKLVEAKEKAYLQLKSTYVTMTEEQHEHIQEIAKLTARNAELTAENDDLKAQLAKTEKALRATEGKLKETKIDLQDKEISFSAVMAILKYYLDFFEALNPSQKALGNAMKNMKKKQSSNKQA